MEKSDTMLGIHVKTYITQITEHSPDLYPIQRLNASSAIDLQEIFKSSKSFDNDTACYIFIFLGVYK